jgi:predicted nucleic acid-binding protein
MAVCGLTKSVVETAIRFIELVPLRTLDALHLACAADWNAEAVVSADRKQLEAAKKLGLRVIGI